jgi:hypothetical protein
VTTHNRRIQGNSSALSPTSDTSHSLTKVVAFFSFFSFILHKKTAMLYLMSSHKREKKLLIVLWLKQSGTSS